jgi:hypothetical protein
MAEPEETNIVDTILDLKRDEPFAPFRVVMSGGDTYLIESGETLVERPNQFFYASPQSKKFEIVTVEGDDV